MYDIELSTHKVQGILSSEGTKHFTALFVLASSFAGLWLLRAYNNWPEENNHIPAVIYQQSLDAAKEHSGVSARQLGRYPQGGYPELGFPAGYQVEHPHGRHRVQATKELGLD